MISTSELRGQAGDVAELEILPDPALMVGAADALDEIYAVLGEFCDRCDKGEIRSTKTFNKFKEILGRRY